MRAVVVTPTSAASIPYLPQLASSFNAGIQGAPPNIDLSWHVQVDGESPETAQQAREATSAALIPCTVSGTGRQRGPAYSRTAGLLNAVTSWAAPPTHRDVVVSIDADDLWLPTGISQLLRPLSERSDLAFTAASNVWIDEDGSKQDIYKPVAGLTGYLPPGTIRTSWESTGVFPFAAACAAYRIPVILGLAGWPSSPTGEDAVLMLNVNDRHPGWSSVERPVFAYRQHPTQSTRSSAHTELRALTQELMKLMA